MSRPTKALKIWKEAYDSARHVMPLEESMVRAASELHSKMGIKLRCYEEANHVVVSAMAPSGLTFDARQPGYKTQTIELRLTEQVLGTFKARDLWR